VTNRIGGEADIPTDYRTYGQMLAFAQERGVAHAGAHFEVPMLAMFCFAIRRERFLEIGALDERFGTGLLEDDDDARALAASGSRCVCAEDVFVHHFGEASFGALRQSGDRARRFAGNRDLFERTQDLSWSEHERRRDLTYDMLVDDLRASVRRVLPAGARAAVISRGDDRLVDLDDVDAEHFPADASGAWAGHYPADGAGAVAALDAARARGAGYLVVPRTSMWWLDHYRQLREDLERRTPLLVDEATCTIYDIRLGAAPGGRTGAGDDQAR
jgi:hypothetical protein